MVRKILITGLFMATMVVLAAYDANAVWINGKWVAKGVQCSGESIVKNIDQNQVTVFCDAQVEVELSPVCEEGSPNAIVVCQNPGGNISIGRAFVNLDVFDAALTVPFVADRKGKIGWVAILGTEGINPPFNENCDVGDISCYCDYDSSCSALRANCPNLNWRPVDVVPICMTATAATYYCDNDQVHNCPCDPTITDTTNPYACASNKGGGNPPWTFDWSITGGLVPLAMEVSECFLPDPDTWTFGERREYSCNVVFDSQ
jgi:hypothetical protein